MIVVINALIALHDEWFISKMLPAVGKSVTSV